MIIVEGRDIAIGYEGEAVLPPFSFAVRKGDYICIVGENGSGKSTFVKTLLSLIRPVKGEISYNGLRSSEIGYLPQQSAIERDFPSSVEEVVLSGSLNRKRSLFGYRKEERERALAELTRLGLADKIRASYQELSGGQQRRVLLARALMATESLILLDEPVAGLDSRSSSELYAIVNELNARGITVIMVTHDIHPALNDATTIFHFSHSSFYQGKKDDYFQTEMGRIFMKEAGHAHR